MGFISSRGRPDNVSAKNSEIAHKSAFQVPVARTNEDAHIEIPSSKNCRRKFHTN